MEKLYELALLEGWIDLFKVDNKWWGFRDRHSVMPEEVKLPAEAFDSIPLAEMYLLFLD